MVHKLAHKMDAYFPSLLEFQTSPEAEMKQEVVKAVMQCMEVAPRLDFLIAATGCVRHLLNDFFPTVVKAALVGANDLVQIALFALCHAGKGDKQQAESEWAALKGVLDTVTGALVSHSNVGVRMLTFKLLEHVALATSASHCPSIKGAPVAPVCFCAGQAKVAVGAANMLETSIACCVTVAAEMKCFFSWAHCGLCHAPQHCCLYYFSMSHAMA